MAHQPRRPTASRSDNPWPVSTAPAPRRTIELAPDEALRLLGSIPIGRIIFTRHALPTARPVNHVLDAGDIIIRTHEGAALVSSAQQGGPQGIVVAYEADDIDIESRLGWSVVATGYCRLVTDPAQVARYQTMLHTWSDQHMDQVVRIHPDLVTGIRLVAADGAT
ncbi:pyridoxamine 5'-phosphate oxidase family protein [Streptomyces ferrugineus]|uniref:Pyridoxamine 5'-phosphate oxidase family protein n=1 Tax=Streptomyces ferrugineus TaxID=1413221 RepID=A0A7M2SCJ2_9ACTN|nr:pyridoxamine 5'-phosphate oxidase family protein [Streptomyces ferrugineus]QOV34042.1 pyridoxamine 5'-phosphate oxidase family protein [Streptomyces ferrugineus]